MERRGVTEPTARNLVRSSPTLIAALAVHLGDADAMIAGAYGRFRTHFNHVRDVIGLREGVKHMAALSLLVMPTRSLFIADTYVNEDPDAETLAEITLLAADAVLRFGIQPKVALLSHSLFGSSDHPSARKMAEAVSDPAPARALARGRRRDARRRRARPGDPPDRVPELAAQGCGQPGDLPQPRLRQHRLQPAEDRGRRPAYRADAARHRAAGARADAVGDRARHPQHDGALASSRRSASPRRGDERRAAMPSTR